MMRSDLESALADALVEARLGVRTGSLNPLLTETCAALHHLELRELRLRRLEAGLAEYEELTRQRERLRSLVAELRALAPDVPP